MSLTPMYDNIVVKPLMAEEKTAGGIYLASPELSKSYAEGVVVAVGEGYKTHDGTIAPLKVVLGDRVIYRKGVEIAVEDGGDEFFVFSEANVVAVKS